MEQGIDPGQTRGELMKTEAAQGLAEGVLGGLAPHLFLEVPQHFALGGEELRRAVRSQAKEEKEFGKEFGAKEAQAGDGAQDPAPKEFFPLGGEGVADAGRAVLLLLAGAHDEAAAFQAIQGGVELAWGHAPDASQIRVEAGEELVAVGRPPKEVAQNHRSHGELTRHIPNWSIPGWNLRVQPAPVQSPPMRLLLLLILWALAALAGPEKLDPILRMLVEAPAELRPAVLAPYGEEPDPCLPVFVELQSGAVGWELPGARSLFGHLATATVPLSRLPRLAEHPGVLRIWASRPLEPLLDRSVPEIGAPALWYGTPGTTGQGVVLGIVDSGVDVLHPAFRTETGGSRLLFYWDQTSPGMGWFPPFWGDEPGEGLYGRVYERRDLEAALRAGTNPAPDALGHGTHVAGIAAGGSALGLPGVAPGADLVVVKTNFYEDSVLDGIRFVLEAARYLGRPAVVNLSLGGHAGSHDGRSPLERAVDLLAQTPGALIVCAAGNEGQSRIHVGGEIRSPTTWTVVPSAASLTVRFWYDDPARFIVTVRAPTGEALTVLPGQSRSMATSSGLVWLDNTLSPLVQEPRQVFLTLSGAAREAQWRVTFEPVFPGRVDGWIESAKMGYFLEGDGERTIAEPGNALSVITVGAYVTRTSWISQAGEQRAEGYALWALAPFSSRGPTRDGRLKPELAAPGAWIASALSSAAAPSSWYVLPDGKHMVLAGTSMAAPHVAGACALLLSLRPDLTRTEVLAALQRGARADTHVGTAPNAAWGWGKLDLPGAWASLGPSQRPPSPWLAALDNPARTGATFRYGCPEGTGWAELQVYDLLGRFLWRESLSPAGGLVRWDLRTLQGHAVASGLYLAVLVTDRGASPPVRVVVQR